MSVRRLLALALGVIAGVLGSSPRPADAAGPTVTVTATASDPKGSTLSYAWRVTDGKILSTSGKTMSWQLPGGPGLHFAYVLVSNGKGGYTERRVAVNTDTIGTAPDIPASVTLKAPAASAPSGNFYTADIRSGYYVPPDSTDGLDNGVYLAGAEAFLKNTSTNAVTSTVKSTVRGFFTVPNVPNGTYDVFAGPARSTPSGSATPASS